jgi:uncharacterized protein YyaL (SSP411 family)
MLQRPSLDETALRALRYLCEHVMSPDGSVYHYVIEERTGLAGQLADQVWMARALLDAYERHGDVQYLDMAAGLMHFVCRELRDEHNGLFYDSPLDEHAVGYLAVREQPLIENALAAECLLRIALYSQQPQMREEGLRVLSGCLEKYRRTGIQGAVYACVIAQALENNWI